MLSYVSTGKYFKLLCTIIAGVSDHKRGCHDALNDFKYVINCIFIMEFQISIKLCNMPRSSNSQGIIPRHNVILVKGYPLLSVVGAILY